MTDSVPLVSHLLGVRFIEAAGYEQVPGVRDRVAVGCRDR
jgi:hypothetical protein